MVCVPGTVGLGSALTSKAFNTIAARNNLVNIALWISLVVKNGKMIYGVEQHGQLGAQLLNDRTGWTHCL